MATVTGITAAKAAAIEAASVVSGNISGSNLFLTTQGGSVINAGQVVPTLPTPAKAVPWDSTTAYVTADVVGYAGMIWRALSNNTNKPPSLFTSIWQRLTGETGTAWVDRDPSFEGDSLSESWDSTIKTGVPTVSLTTTAGEFETGRQAVKIAMATSQAQTLYPKDENIVRGGDYITVTVRAKLAAAAAGVTINAVMYQNDATGLPIAGASGVSTVNSTVAAQTLTTTWTSFTFTFTAVNAKPRANILLTATSTGASANVLIDRVTYTRALSAPDIFTAQYAIPSGNFTVPLSTFTDVPNLTLTVDVPSTGAVYEIHATFDVEKIVNTNNNNVCIGQLVINGVVQGGTLNYVAAGTSNRTMVSRTWLISGITAGSRVFKMQAAATSVASEYRVGAPHSMLLVRRVA